MDFQLSEDQRALVSALQGILADHNELPQSERFSFFWHDADLQAQLEQSGFLDAARDIGPLEAALVTYECAKNVAATDTIGRGLVAPLACPGLVFEGPVALVKEADLGRAIRNLPIAQTLLVECAEDVRVLRLDPGKILPVKSIYGFPYGRLADAPDLSAAEHVPGAAATMRQWWRVGLAAEIAGASAAAIDFTIDYVKQRNVFGRPVGSFQTVQHRLVQRHGHALAGYYLAMRAAWSGNPVDADIAASQTQMGIKELLFDLHQFNGGMGVTTEHQLHFWTYRVRALQAETGGTHAAGLDIAANRWSQTAKPSAASQLSMAGS